MPRLAPGYYSSNTSVYTAAELLRLFGWISTGWLMIWKAIKRPLPESEGHLIPCYWENMRCRAEDLSTDVHEASVPMLRAVRKFADHWEIHHGQRPSSDPGIVDWGNTIYFSPGSSFGVLTAYARARMGAPAVVFYATTYLRNGHAIVTSSQKNVLPICPGSELRFFRGPARALLENHQRAVAGRNDVLICDSFAEWVAAWDRHTEIQSQWEIERGLWKPMNSATEESRR